MEISTKECSITTHMFEEIIADIPITFYSIKMKECIFFWIGDQSTFDNLAVAMNTPYGSLPITTSIFGQFSDDSGTSLAMRLSKKTRRQVFASCNLSKSDHHVLLLINKRLMEEITNYPNKF